MKRVEIRPGSPEFHLVDAPNPVPGPHDLLVKVSAASLNYRDFVYRKAPRETPLVPLSDGVGTVVEAGSETSKFKPGDRVSPNFFPDWIDGDMERRYHDNALGGSANGVLSELICLPESSFVKVPPHLTNEEAACLPCAGVTAYSALFELSRLHKDQDLLVLGTGGVSVFGLQFGKAIGARVHVTSSSNDKLALAQELGADSLLNYNQDPDWDKTLWDRTNKRGMDHVLEVGGPGTLQKSLAVVKYGGTVSLIGVLTGPKGQIDPMPVMFKSVKLQGLYVGSRTTFERLNEFLEAHQIHPVSDRVFPMNEVDQAYEHMKSGSHFGKVVIKLD